MSNYVPVFGLIGGVGSGKSSVARRLAARRRVEVIDGDALGHQALERPSVKNQIRNTFGAAVFDESGQVHRRALGRLVFGAAEASRQARRQLETIVHPVIRESIEQQIHQARAGRNAETILLDAAVLLEAGWNELCDAVVFVDAPHGQRLERVAGRGWNEETLKQRESSQWTLDEKRQAADYVIDNSGSLDDAAQSLERILNEFDVRQPSKES